MVETMVNISQQELFQNTTPPKSNIQEVLYKLISTGTVSIKDFPHLSGFRTRLSELKINHNLFLDRRHDIGINKFGNSFHYAVHILPISEIDNAISIYNKLNADRNNNK